MTTELEHRKTNHTLPSWVSQILAQQEREERDTYIARLRAGGWTLQSIADASGLTRERVRQIVATAGDANLIPAAPEDASVPELPVKAQREPRTFIEPDPDKLARLKALQPYAQQVRANSPTYRAEAEEYTRLVADVHQNDGVPLYRLALRLGVSHGALRFRLARYGYKLPVSGASKVYTPVKSDNRVGV